MTESNDPHAASLAAWRDGDRAIPVPDTAMLPEGDRPGPAAVDLLKQAAQGAHHTIDRLADRAEPAVRQLGESLGAAEAALQANAGQLREAGDAWMEALRGSVRSQPLVAVALAAALGMLLARISR